MSRRKDRARTPGLWIATNALPVTGGHPFYQRLNQILDTHAFDAFVEAQCAPFYAATVGRPSRCRGPTSGCIGYFEGIRSRDCLAHRGFAGAAGLPGAGPGRGPTRALAISRTRRLIDLETHRPGSCRCSRRRSVKGQTIGIDATTRGQRGAAEHRAPRLG